MSVPFLLEIGTEEIPDWMIQPARSSNLGELFEELLEDNRAGRQGVTAGRHAAPPGAARRRPARAPAGCAKSW